MESTTGSIASELPTVWAHPFEQTRCALFAGVSVQTILAAGFLFLGGILLFIVDSIYFLGDWVDLFSRLCILLGVIPLVIHLAKRCFIWYCKLPIFPTDTPKKED